MFSGALFTGPIIDKAGRTAAVLLVFAVQAGALVTSHYANNAPLSDGEHRKLLFSVAAALLGAADSAGTTLMYAAVTECFESSEQVHADGADAGGDGDDQDALLAAGTSVQRPDAGYAGEDCPLLQGAAEDTSAGFSSTDGFSVLYLLQGSCVGILFFVVPLVHREGGSDATDAQFFWIEVGSAVFMVVGAIGLLLDGKAIDRKKQPNTK